MEWVETTGRSVEEAKEAALDELGVDEVEAEFEVVAEPQTGLFGRLRSEARVRARVRPTAPRAKEDRRDRRRRNQSASRSGADSSAPDDTDTKDEDSAAAPTGAPQAARVNKARQAPADGPTGDSEDSDSSDPRTSSRSRRRRRGGATGGEIKTASEERPSEAKGAAVVELALQEQAEIAKEFLDGLSREFALEADVVITHPDEDTAELQMSGGDLGLLIGPKGATLIAIQNLVRTYVFHKTGATNGHINVDVGGYRQKRSEALVRFATQKAAEVQANGARIVFEPMASIDRKVVHDAISKIDGVVTTSEGEEPRRRVVLLPAPNGSSPSE